MRALITRASGFIGAHVVAELVGAGAEVLAFDRQPGMDCSRRQDADTHNSGYARRGRPAASALVPYARMSRESALLAAVTSGPSSTSELYDRVGYVTLARLGLVPYHAFRAELARLSASGVIASRTARDGSTMWRRAETVLGGVAHSERAG